MNRSTPGLPVHHQLTSIESVMPSSHLILCRPLLLLPPIPPSIRVFSNESTLRMRWQKYWSFIKRLFSSSSLSAIRVVSSAYLRLLIFLPAILLPACASSSPAFLMMYSADKLNKQGDNIQPWCTPFPIWNWCCSKSSFNCCFLTCIRVSQEQVRWSVIPISFRIFHSLLWSTLSKALA